MGLALLLFLPFIFEIKDSTFYFVPHILSRGPQGFIVNRYTLNYFLCMFIVFYLIHVIYVKSWNENL